jgi:hypothetical protein
MKKLNVLLLSIVTMGTIVSCEKDKDSESIEGTWKFITVEEKTNGQSSGPTNPFKECSDQGKINTITFKNSNTYTSVGYDPGDDCSQSIDDGVYTLSSDKKTLTMDTEEVIKIVKVTKTDLILSTTYTEQGVSIESILTLKK